MFRRGLCVDSHIVSDLDGMGGRPVRYPRDALLLVRSKDDTEKLLLAPGYRVSGIVLST